MIPARMANIVITLFGNRWKRWLRESETNSFTNKDPSPEANS
jgi:hypothetical protein